MEFFVIEQRDTGVQNSTSRLELYAILEAAYLKKFDITVHFEAAKPVQVLPT